MQPGLWVIATSGFAAITASCGVTPHAQNTGISRSRIVGASPKSGRARFSIPIAAGSPRWIGAPCACGYFAVIRIASIACGARQRPPRDDQRSCKRTRRLAGDVGAVHRHVVPFLDVTDRQTGPLHGGLETERATEQEGDEIVTPAAADVGRLVDQFAAAIHAIPRHTSSR